MPRLIFGTGTYVADESVPEAVAKAGISGFTAFDIPSGLEIPNSNAPLVSMKKGGISKDTAFFLDKGPVQRTEQHRIAKSLDSLYNSKKANFSVTRSELFIQLEVDPASNNDAFDLT